MNVYLTSYGFRGGRYSLEVPADSEIEARARIEAIRNSLDYDGELHLSVPVPGGSWLAWLLGSAR